MAHNPSLRACTAGLDLLLVCMDTNVPNGSLLLLTGVVTESSPAWTVRCKPCVLVKSRLESNLVLLYWL